MISANEMDATKTCPFCAETIPATAIRCPLCRTDLPASPSVQVAAAVATPIDPETRSVLGPPLKSPAPQPDNRASASETRRPSTKVILAAASLLGAIVVVLILVLRPDRVPASIGLSGAPPTIVEYSPVHLVAAARNRHGAALPDTSVGFSVDPAGTATITPGGDLSCLRRGDLAVVGSAGAVTVRALVRCRPVARLMGPPEISLTLGSKPAKAEIVSLDREGERYSDVPIELTSSDASIFFIDNGRLSPVGIGTATLGATIGFQSLKITVNVVQNTLFQKFELADGASQSFPVSPAGSYRVRIKVMGDSAGASGVSVAFTGTTCAQQSEAQTHDVPCDFLDGGTVIVTNSVGVPDAPDPFAPGPSVKVRLSLDRIKIPSTVVGAANP